MMKGVSILALCVAAVVSLPADTYDPKYDNFDVDQVVKNGRLLKSYGNCFLDKGPCTSEGADFKKVIEEALQTQCGKCSPAQKTNVRKAARGFQKELPEVWEALVEKYDPEHKYKESFQQFLNASD